MVLKFLGFMKVYCMKASIHNSQTPRQQAMRLFAMLSKRQSFVNSKLRIVLSISKKRLLISFTTIYWLKNSYLQNSIRPTNWQKNPCELDPDNKENNGFKNFDFIVWMRQTLHSTFRKNYRKLLNKGAYKYGLPAGEYTLVADNCGFFYQMMPVKY